jgi:hypothetical protein
LSQYQRIISRLPAEDYRQQYLDKNSSGVPHGQTSGGMMTRKSITIMASAAMFAGAASVGLALTAPAASAAEAGSPQPPGSVYACVDKTGSIEWLEVSQDGHKCADGYELWRWVANAPSTAVDDLGGVATVKTGGGFVSNATLAGTVTLPAGTYLLTLNAKATPSDTSSAQVFPQFFVYDQKDNANFTGDLFNVGSGALESGPHTTIDSYYSGSTVITVPAGGETLYVYAFGYDSDQSAGTYDLDDLSVTTVNLNPSS